MRGFALQLVWVKQIYTGFTTLARVSGFELQLGSTQDYTWAGIEFGWFKGAGDEKALLITVQSGSRATGSHGYWVIIIVLFF